MLTGALRAQLPGPLDPLQGGENIATAFILSGPLPINSTGTTEGYLDDYNEECGFDGSGSPDVVYAYTPPADVTVDLDLCGSEYDTRLYVYENTLTPGSPFACNDDFYYNTECGFYVSKIESVYLTGGNTYFIVVDGYTEMEFGNYTLAISEIGAPGCVWGLDIVCPPWALDENETCGTDANGGCNMDPVTQEWETVPSTGAAFCGTTWADGGFRDTDWFELVLTQPSSVSLTANADREIIYGLVETTTPGVPDCSTLTGEINPSDFAGPCFETYLDLGVLAAGTYWFFVEMTADDDFPCDNHYLLDFAVNALTCEAPEALLASGITPTSADLSWIETGTATAWEYEIVLAYSTPTEIGTITYVNPVTVAGLTSNTSYDFYVRAVCESDFSTWTGPFNFTTGCSGTSSIPWDEGFESPWPPPCWTDPETIYYGWDLSTYGTEHSGSEWAYCNKAGSQLITKDFNLTSDAFLVFWYRVENAAFPQDLTVKTGEDIIYQITGDTNETYQEVNVSLAAYTGQTISVSFTGGTGAGGIDPGICLDDVSVKLAFHWTGNIDTNWNDPGNWSMTGVPGPDDIVTIPSVPPGERFPEIGSGFTAECYKINVSPAATLKVLTGGTLNVKNPQ
jgi:hypothetical protein